MTFPPADEIAARLAEYVGISGGHRVGGPDDRPAREKAARMLLPNDDLAWALEYLFGFYDPTGGPAGGGRWKNPDTCAIQTCAYFRDVLGMIGPELDGPYQKRVGQAFSDVERVARRYGGWTIDLGELEAFPDVGDVLEIGRGQQGHMVNVSGSNAASGSILSVEGGKTDGSWTLAGEYLFLATPAGPFLVDVAAPYRPDGSPNGLPVVGRFVLAAAAAAAG